MADNKGKAAYLKDKLQGWPDAMCLTSKDVADLIGLLDKAAAEVERLKEEVQGRENAFYIGFEEGQKLTARAEKAEAELEKSRENQRSDEEIALRHIAEESHTHPEEPTTAEEWEAERECRHCQAAHTLGYAHEEIRDTFHRLNRAAKEK